MNKIHSKVWNKELGQIVVASEFATSDSAGVVQGAASARRTLLAVALAPLLALAGTTAVAQDWTVSDGDNNAAVIGDGGQVTVEGDQNISVALTGNDDDATLAITLERDIDVDTITVGDTFIDTNGVAIGAATLNATGLHVGAVSVTGTGINAGGNTITGVAAGTAADHAVNFGQLDAVQDTIADHAAAIADNADNIATNADDILANADEIDAVRATASAGWDISAEGGTAANVGSGGAVDFSGDGNIEVARTGTDLTFSLADDISVDSIQVGGMTLDSGGIDAGNKRITGLADGVISETSTDAVTGQQLHNALFEGGEAFGVRYFRANSTADDSAADGAESVAIGPQTVAGGDSSFAAGDGATITATAEGAIALGQGAVAGTEGGDVDDGVGSIAIGRDSQASGNSTVALGDGANVASEHVADATALGAGARVTGNFATGGTAVGADAHASAGNATALGTNAHASGGGSIAVGQARAAAGNAIAAGTGAYVGSYNSIALGTGAGVGTEGVDAGDRTDHIAIGTAAGRNVVGNQSTAIGYAAGQGVIGDGNVALGVEAGRGLDGNNNISIGVNANDGAGARAQAVAIGDGTAAGSDSVALGSGASAAGSETVALGKDSRAGANGVALGAHAEAQGSNVAIGRNSIAYESDVTGSGYLTGEAAPGSAVSVGSSNPGEAFQRRITNVADGAQRYDAVNVGQLQSAQQAVANLVGGNVAVQPDGSFGGYIIELQDGGGNLHQYTTVAAAINAVSSGDISVLPGDAVIYNPNGTITVAEGVVGTDAVNVEQLNEAIAESGVKYFSANTTVDANRDNDGATATDAMAIGPAAVASGASSLAAGHAARVNAGAHNGVAIGYDVSARAENATVLGNRSHTYDAGGVAIGQEAVSRGQNSIVMGTGAEADPKSGQTVDNAIVIGTAAEATADDGIAVGQSALASEDRAVAQGFDAHAMAVDSQAFGTRARTTGVNSQASGTDAHASGANAIATGTSSRGYATDGIAMGTGAISGFVVDIPGDAPRNHGSIAIGDTSRADDLNAMALGVEAQARAGSATAIGDSAVATEDAEDGLAVGSSARVTAQNASAFGRGAEAVAEDALAAGSGARASGQSASAVGHGAEASATNASAFGQGARALHEGSVALGSGAETAAAVGTTSYTVDKNTYSFAGTAPVATVSVGAPGQERTITNVAAGRISAQSTDAINGSQLYSTNQAVDALADDLDTAGRSVATALGGTSVYDPDTHTVTAGLSVRGNNYTNVQDALDYVGQGWDVSAQGGAVQNVAPGGQVDFSNQDGNINIARAGTNLTFNLDDDLTIDNSITVGGTVINGTSVTTTNLTAGGETRLGDSFVVNNDGDAIYNGSEVATRADGLSFAGDTGGSISKTLGDNTPLTISGGLAATEATTGANLRVDSTGGQLNLVMARDLTDLDSITINNGPVINSSGIDMGDTRIINLAPGQAGTDAVNVNQLNDVAQNASAGWNVLDEEGNEANIGPDGDLTFIAGNDNLTVELSDDTDDAGVMEITLADNIELTEDGSLAIGDGTDGSTLDMDGLTVVDGGTETTIGAGTVSVTDGTHETTFGPTTVVVGGDHSITIDGTAGTIGGLTNTEFDPDVTYTGGLAATQEQLSQVNSDLTTAGLDFVGDDGTVVHRDLGEQLSITGGATGALSEGNIGVTANADGDGLVVELADNIELTEDGSLTIGDAELDNDGLTVVDDAGNETTVGAAGTTVEDAAGNTTTVAAGGTTVDDGAGNVTTVAATGTTVTDGNATTSVEAGVVTVTANPVTGPANTIVIDANTGTIGGLTNTEFDPDVTYTGGLAATQEQLSQVNSDLTTAGLDFVGDDGTVVHRDLGEQLSITGGATGALSEGNIGVTANADGDGLVVELADNIELTEDGSLTIGDAELDNDGLTVVDDAGNETTVGAAGTTVEDGTGNVTTVAAGGTTVDDGAGNVTTVAATGTTVTDGNATTSVEAGVVTVTANPVTGPANTIVIDANTGTIGGLANQTIDYQGFADGSGRAATEEQLDQVNQTANMGWNISAQGDNATNVGPGGSVDLSNTDGNIVVAKADDSNDVTFDLADDLVIGNSVTVGDTTMDATGVAIGADVHLGSTGLVITGGPSVTSDGINAGNMVITNVAPGEISATSTDAINGSQLHGMGDSIVNVIGGNAELNPDGTITTSDIGGTGHDNIDDAIRSANDAANAGWTATDADGNAANIGPNGSVAFTGDGNISVAQTGEDNDGQVEITLNRDLDVDSITAGNTVIDTDGVQVGDNVHLGDTGLVIEGGPSVTTDGIDAGGSTLTNVAAGVNDTDAANVGQLNQVAGDVNDLGDRMDVVEGDVSDLQAGATGPFQVSQEAPIVPPTPTGANSAAGGSGADASGDNSTALGNQAVASGANSTAVGQGAQATHDNSVALGQGSATTVGAQSGYDAAYVGSSNSSGEVNVGNRTISGVAPGVAGNDAVNVNQLNAGVNHAVVTANDYTDQRINQVQGDVWNLHGRVDDLEKSINSGVATAMAMRQAPYVAGATTYFAGFGAYKDQGALGVSMRRTADNGRWSLEGGFSANRDGAGGYIGVSGVIGSK